MMRNVRRPMAGLLTAATLWMAPGCGEGPPPVDTSTTEATVTGTVKVGGVPATEGEIIFNPANVHRRDVPSRSAPIGADGKYTIKTLTGENQVKLGGAIAKKQKVVQAISKTVDVKSSGTTFDFDVDAK